MKKSAMDRYAEKRMGKPDMKHAGSPMPMKDMPKATPKKVPKELSSKSKKRKTPMTMAAAMGKTLPGEKAKGSKKKSLKPYP